MISMYAFQCLLLVLKTLAEHSATARVNPCLFHSQTSKHWFYEVLLDYGFRFVVCVSLTRLRAQRAFSKTKLDNRG